MIRSLAKGRSTSTERQQKNALGLMVLGSLGLGGANLLLLFFLFVAYVKLANQPPPSLVQLAGGAAIATAPMDSDERTPAVIQTFVQQTLTTLMSATGTIPGAEGELKPDPGVEVGDQLKVPTVAFLSSFGLSEDFRSTFLKGLAQRIPPSVWTQENTQVVLVIQDISDPEPIAPGQWKVVMIASRVTFDAVQPVGMPEPFNKEIFLHAVTPPAVRASSSALERQIAETRNAGLEIYAMRNYVSSDLRAPEHP